MFHSNRSTVGKADFVTELELAIVFDSMQLNVNSNYKLGYNRLILLILFGVCFKKQKEETGC